MSPNRNGQSTSHTNGAPALGAKLEDDKESQPKWEADESHERGAGAPGVKLKDDREFQQKRTSCRQT